MRTSIRLHYAHGPWQNRFGCSCKQGVTRYNIKVGSETNTWPPPQKKGLVADIFSNSAGKLKTIGECMKKGSIQFMKKGSIQFLRWKEGGFRTP